ncbi:Dabb family protein [Spartinivicinus poritis]|uniref:Dabb family protein n=1 Tax=Spartinivicinus poritis TaxID=2994640 RepID=A0ABT5UAR6_9GAMM|nr:Dabb family protein [Spartinivicinus sp. A2-2]MDE1463476.1 Dabb family protein [Spartinivicinus sp. A2-2]
MKKILLTGLILMSLTSVTSAHIIDEGNAKEFASSPKPIQPFNYKKATQPNTKKGLTRHIVLFDLKDNISKAHKDEIINRFLALRDTKFNGRPYIHNIEVGTRNISREGVGKGYDLAFIVTFLSRGDLNFYVGKPAIDDPKFYDQNHENFKNFVGPFLKVGKNPDGSDNPGVIVFDYQVLNGKDSRSNNSNSAITFPSY